MKNLIISILVAQLGVASTIAVAADDETPTAGATLSANAYSAVTRSNLNTAETLTVKAITNRAGFVKNDFSITISSNVTMGLKDGVDRFGVVTASDKGKNVFTGTSEGGSVSVCGAQAAVGAADDAVATASLDLTKDNGCGRSS